MIDSSIWLALIAMGSVFASGTLAPIAIAVVQYRINRAERIENNTRQDTIANRASEVAIRAEETAKLLLAANERVASDTRATNSKLDVIHTLVNSNMTAALQAELDATVRELAMMNEVVELKKVAGHKPGPETLLAINSTAARISELKSTIADRTSIPA